jgi:hypothetical protein
MFQGTATDPRFAPSMPFNLPGTLVPLYALFNPRLILPSLAIVRLTLYHHKSEP